MPQSACRLRPPGVLRQPPIDAFQQISQLRRRDGHRAILAFARNGRWPDKTPAFEPFCEQAHAKTVVPQHFDQRAAPAAEHEQMASVRIALERLLHQQRQAVEALAHVGVAGCQPHPRASRQRDHRRRPLPAIVAIVVVSVAASTAPVIRIRDPFANSTSIRPRAGKPLGAGSAAICTAAKLDAGCDSRTSCRRHPYSWLAWIPASRATLETLALGSSEAATSRSFSAALQRRRRSTDVITSIALLT